MAVLLFLVPRASGGGAEKVISSLSSCLAEDNKVYLVTTVREDGVENYPISNRVSYINVYRWAEYKETEKAAALSNIREQNQSHEFREKTRRAIRKQLSKWSTKFPRAMTEPVRIQMEKSDFDFQIQTVKEMKEFFRVDCSISFLNSANYINVMSSVGEKTIISIRSYPESRYAPKDNWTESGRKRIAEACERADIIVPVSKEIGDCLTEIYRVSAHKMQVIYNYVDIEDIRGKCSLPIEDDDLEKRIAKAGFIFVSPGRLTEKKGQWHLIRAFQEVHNKHPDTLLIIPGREGKDNENVANYLRRLVEENKLTDCVLFPGFLKNPYALLAKCDVFVSTSFNEGFPNALVEAMALGLPVISTDCRSGPREILAPESDYHQKTISADYAEFGILVPECSGRKN